MPRKQSVSVCACCTPCSYLKILRCNHVPPQNVMPTHLYWVGTRQITENLACGGADSRGPTPTMLAVPPLSGRPAWRSSAPIASPLAPNSAAGGKITFDIPARGCRTGANFFPLTSRNGVGVVNVPGWGLTYLASQPPAGDELSHYLEVAICDQQVTARMAADILRFTHGAFVQAYNLPSGPQDFVVDGPALLQNTIWNPGTAGDRYASAYEYATATSLQSQAANKDYYVCRYRISLGNQTRLIQTVADSNAPQPQSLPYAPPLLLVADVDTPQNQGGSTVFATAYSRWAYPRGIDSYGSLTPAYSPLRSSRAVGGFSDHGVNGLTASPAGALKVFRDGTLAAQLTVQGNSAVVAGLFDATNIEGVYLLWLELLDDKGKPPVLLASFVVDKTPPLVAAAQRNDIYVNDESKAFEAFPRQTGAACTEAARVGPQLQGFSLYSSEALLFQNANIVAPGQHAETIDLDIYDLAGNKCKHIPELTFTVHPVPQNEKLGAHARIELPFIGGDYVNTSTPDSPGNAPISTPSMELLYDSPVSRFLVRFDKPVVGLTAGNIEIRGRKAPNWDTDVLVPTGSILVQKISGQEWLVDLLSAQGDQVANSVWYATVKFDDDSVTVEGDEEDVCRLAARSMWAVMPEKKALKPIDCTVEEAVLGGVSSVSSQTFSDPLRVYKDITLSSSSEMYVPPSAGEFTADKTRKTFIPNVPSSMFSGATGAHSYFDLPTTIYPAPPALVEPCAAPSSTQKHSSVICSANEITNITVRLPWPYEGGQFFDQGFPTQKTYTFVPSCGGYPCQQNIWCADDAMFLYAYRNASVYRGLQTAILHRLTFRMTGFFRSYIKFGANTINPNMEEYQLLRVDVDPMQLSWQQEASLVSGGAVQVAARASFQWPTATDYIAPWIATLNFTITAS
jgi:hypothetical protein